MTGYIYCHSACLSCRRIFAYNPHHVPSTRVNGQREPICQNCIEHINRERVKLGHEPFAIHPDAYEPLPEELL